MAEKKIKRGAINFRISPILIILGLGLIARICLAFFGTLKLDQGTFIGWSNSLAENGFPNFYRGWSDYLPGYLYILWFLGKIRGVIPDVLLYKLPAILADLATGILVYKIVSKLKNEKWGLASTALYVFNPAVLANSTLWGQIDSLTSLFSLLSVYLLPFNLYFSAAGLAIGVLIKPQAAFVLPVILFLFLRNKYRPTALLGYCFTGLLVFAVSFVPFAGGNLWQFIFQRLSLSAGQYSYTSVNAFNFWGLFGFWRGDTVYLISAGIVAAAAIWLFPAVKTWRKKGAGYLLTAIVFLSSFLFLTRMHERHLLPVLAPLAVSFGLWPELTIPYVVLSLTYLANLFYSYNWISFDFVEVFPSPVTALFIFLNIASLGFIVWRAVSNKKIKLPLPTATLSSRKAKLLIGFILAFTLFTRVAWLGNPQGEYFDEVYHAFTARQILHGNPMAWEWWNTPPEGFAYEWTHPPLAKLGMVLGMKIFGENSFGWRVPGALLGVGSVFLIYLIAKELFKDSLLGILSAAVFGLDGLALVMGRIGMNDAYLLFFALLSIFLFLKNQNYLSAITFGLALASKWSAIWVVPVIFVLWLRRGKKFELSLVWFIFLPFIIYLLTYLPMFLSGHGLNVFWEMQKQMWWYHTGLRATHPYTSPWWNWPLLIRPIYLYTSDEIGGFVSRIYAMGNPFVFWFGLISVAASFVYAFVERNKNLAFVIFAYLVFFVPWAASPRIMFLYHYLPSIPFMCIATGYVLRRFPKLITYYLLLITLFFIYFYPHWAGLNIPLWLDRSYYWFSSWR